MGEAETDARIFVSCLTYELSKRLGVELAAKEFARMCECPEPGDLPCARMVGRLRQFGALALYHAAGSCLPKLRSRCAHAALESGADYWVMLDDDVECESATLDRLLAAAGDPLEACIVVLPCRLRGDAGERDTVNVRFVDAGPVVVGNGGPIREIIHGGCGCMVVTRGALQRVSEYYRRELSWQDDDRCTKVALFEMIRELPLPDPKLRPLEQEPEWLGEDLSFCRRVRETGVPIFALLSGLSFHDGQALKLNEIC
jgi:hypothetical protein